jgi:hypothetical protein
MLLASAGLLIASLLFHKAPARDASSGYFGYNMALQEKLQLCSGFACESIHDTSRHSTDGE